MRAKEIYDKILSLNDLDLLETLPTIDKECCAKCKSFNFRERKNGTFYCNICKTTTTIKFIHYYEKNKTTNPRIAVERHRLFWGKIYEIELSKEYITYLKQNLM